MILSDVLYCTVALPCVVGRCVPSCPYKALTHGRTTVAHAARALVASVRRVWTRISGLQGVVFLFSVYAAVASGVFPLC